MTFALDGRASSCAVSIAEVSLSVKQPNQSEWPLRNRLRLLASVLVVAASLGAAYLLPRRPVVMAEIAVAGLVCAAIAWWLVGLAFPRRKGEVAVAASEWEDTRVNAIPRRRHEHEEISNAVSSLRQAVKDRIEALPTLGHQAGHDPLTRLADRASLYALSDWLDENDGLPEVELCLLCVELKGVEPVKARYGGEAGDHVLTKVAKRLRDVSREEDFLFRLGGDEFMLMVPSPAGQGLSLAKSVGKRVMTNVQRPLSYLTVSNLAISCSVGSAIWPIDAAKLGDVLRHADTALADTRVSGRGAFKQYNAAHHNRQLSPS